MKKKLPILEKIKIEKVAAEGKSMAHVDDKVVFVPYVVPGDVVDVQVTRNKHSFMEARVINFHEYSPLRDTPRCKHYGVCGGCKWQCLRYEEQLRAKQQQVIDNLTRIGHIELPEVSPILGSEKTYHYRNKLEFGFSNRRWILSDEPQNVSQHNALGFHITGAFDKILDIDECFLMDDMQNRIRNAIRDYAINNSLEFYDLRANEGLLRSIMIRDSNTRQLMLLIQFRINNATEHAQAMSLLQFVSDEFPEITSLLYVDNHKANDTFGDQEVKVYRGEDHIFEEMEGLRFKVGPKSFYQTNTEQAYNLYKVVRDFAFDTSECPASSHPLVYDLYTGTGTIANFVASKASQVIGIEYVPEAIEDAKENSRINSIDNTLFFAGDMKDVLNDQFIAQHGKPHVIITDPPRAGMHKDVIDTILRTSPERIVYVSCNPTTQARDLELLSTSYKVVRVQPVDMFPHTQHVENVVLLRSERSERI